MIGKTLHIYIPLFTETLVYADFTWHSNSSNLDFNPHLFDGPGDSKYYPDLEQPLWNDL